jgi:type II secretory pathway component GspD/PulD (secretin)
VKSMMPVCVATCLLAFVGPVSSQTSQSDKVVSHPAEGTSAESDSAANSTGIPIDQIIAAVAKKSGKKYLLDPRVRAHVTIIGQDVSKITHAQLLTILKVHGYMAFESGGYVQVVPDANLRQSAIPTLSGKETYPDAQPVSLVLPLRNVPAALLVPILRPMMQQAGQLAAFPCTNTLLMVDNYANVRRLEAIVQTLDVGTAFKPEKCEYPGSHRDDK